MLREIVLVFAALLAVTAATQVFHCDSGKPYENANQVRITGCDSPPCKLKKNTRVEIEQLFVPSKDVQDLKTSVYAIFGILPVPFIGVNGNSACDSIYNTDGTKAGCSLKAGTEYLYKTSFPILSNYPPVSPRVHYALVEGSENISCFEVPSKITK